MNYMKIGMNYMKIGMNYMKIVINYIKNRYENYIVVDKR